MHIKLAEVMVKESVRSAKMPEGPGYSGQGLDEELAEMVAESVRKQMSEEATKITNVCNQSCEQICRTTCSDITAHVSGRLDALEQRSERIENGLDALNKTVSAALAKLSHSNSAPDLGTSGSFMAHTSQFLKGGP